LLSELLPASVVDRLKPQQTSVVGSTGKYSEAEKVGDAEAYGLPTSVSSVSSLPSSISNTSISSGSARLQRRKLLVS